MNEKYCLTECYENRITLSVLDDFLKGYGWLWHQCYAEGRIDELLMKTAKSNVARFIRPFGWRILYGAMKCKIIMQDRVILRGGYWD